MTGRKVAVLKWILELDGEMLVQAEAPSSHTFGPVCSRKLGQFVFPCSGESGPGARSWASLCSHVVAEVTPRQETVSG